MVTAMSDFHSNVLVIDSHKGARGSAQNLHWLNARTIAASLGADFIWSYPGVNLRMRGGYDVIVFNHASHYAYTDAEWIRRNPTARLVYIVNEYNLGEPRTLWTAVKESGRHYHVIANHPPEPSKIVRKYVDSWTQINLNALAFDPSRHAGPHESSGCIYYGSFRADRARYFQQYLAAGLITISTHIKNQEKFEGLRVCGPWADRLDWERGDLAKWKYSLYIEDETTHTHYNYLANRFYEALNYGVFPVFGRECIGTIQKSGYAISSRYVIDRPEHIDTIQPHWNDMETWRDHASRERDDVIRALRAAILGDICVKEVTSYDRDIERAVIPLFAE